jgi:hypothetical protein
MGLKQSTADPCLYFKWVNGRLVMMMSWIDDNAIVGQESDVMELKKARMNQFECEDCGPMDEYVGCTIEKLKTGGVKFRQKVLLQSYRDEFDIHLRSSILQRRQELCLESLTKAKNFSRP